MQHRMLLLSLLLAGVACAHAAPLRFTPDSDLTLTHAPSYKPPPRPADLEAYIERSLRKTSLSLLQTSSAAFADDVASFDPQPPLCGPCQLLMQVAEWVAESEPALSLLETLGDDLCAQYFNQSTWCPELVHAIVAEGAKVPAILKHVGLYEPVRFCSAFSFCTVSCCTDATTPQQIALNVGQNATERHVSWVTGGNATASEVVYGLNGRLDQRVKGYALSMNTGGWLGTFHRCVLTGLRPNEMYSYKVGGISSNATVHSFSTWDSQALKTPFHIAIVGDMAASESPYALLNINYLNNRSQAGAIDLVIHAGDVGYGDGYEATFDDFFNLLQPTMTTVPFVVCPGNHELLFNFSSYLHRFFTPGLGATPVLETHGNTVLPASARHRRAAAPSSATTSSPPTGSNMYASWDVGCVHFVGLNSEDACNTAYMDDAQIAWLKADLAATSARMQAAGGTLNGECSEASPTFIVVYMHRPLYCSDADSSNCQGIEALYLQEKLEDLFVQHGVDLVLSGHMHNIERTVNVRAGKPDASGPVYVVNGAGGNREGVEDSWFNPAPVWSAYRGSVAGVGQLSILNATALHLQFFAQPTQAIEQLAPRQQLDGTMPTLVDEVFIRARDRRPATPAKMQETREESLVAEM